MSEIAEAIGKRLEEYLIFKNISLNKLGSMAGTSGTQIKNIVTGTRFGIDKLITILYALPQLNERWLLFGEGDMERGIVSTNTQNGIANISGNNNKQKIMQGKEATEYTAPNDKIKELKDELERCKSDKKWLEQRVSDQQTIIELLRKEK